MERPSGFSTMAGSMAEAGNYFDWAYRELAPHLGRSVLEVGPGYGAIARRVLKDGRSYRAVDQDASVIGFLKKELSLGSDLLAAGDMNDPSMQARWRGAGVDTVLAVNVLEHVEDDLALAKAMAACAPSGRFVVMVPAMEALYGSLDKDAGHVRRYTRATLAALLGAVGTLRRLSYFNGLGALTWLLSARVLRLKLDSEATNRSVLFYDRCLIPVARILEPALRPFMGQSLIAAADIRA